MSKISIQIHNKTGNDGNYIIDYSQKVRSIRFVNQGNCITKLNNALNIPVGGDFEFKADEGGYIVEKFYWKFHTHVADNCLPSFCDNFNNLIIILMTEINE